MNPLRLQRETILSISTLSRVWAKGCLQICGWEEVTNFPCNCQRGGVFVSAVAGYMEWV